MSYFAKKQPKDGDTILHCGHVKKVTHTHFFFLPEKLKFRRPDGTFDEAEWVVQCQECFDKLGSDPSKIKFTNFIIGGDSTWVGDEPEIKAEPSNQN